MTETVAGLTSRGLPDVADDARLRELAEAPVFTVFRRVATSPRGLTEPEAADRLRRFGDNEPCRAADDGVAARLVGAVRSPFVALLAGLAPPPAGYLVWLVAYGLAAHLVKKHYLRRHQAWM